MDNNEKAIINQHYIDARKASMYYDMRGEDTLANLMRERAREIEGLASDLHTRLFVPTVETKQQWREEFKKSEVV